MTKLWYAFLELPSWQGIVLISVAVLGVAIVALSCFTLGYRSRGRDDES